MKLGTHLHEQEKLPITLDREGVGMNVGGSQEETLGPCETTKLTQELAVKLEQGRDLRQWHSMAN